MYSPLFEGKLKKLCLFTIQRKTNTCSLSGKPLWFHMWICMHNPELGTEQFYRAGLFPYVEAMWVARICFHSPYKGLWGSLWWDFVHSSVTRHPLQFHSPRCWLINDKRWVARGGDISLGLSDPVHLQTGLPHHPSQWKTAELQSILPFVQAEWQSGPLAVLARADECDQPFSLLT